MAGGQLLKVERMVKSASSEEGGDSFAPAFFLTFDLGRIAVHGDRLVGHVVVEEAANCEALPAGLAPANEEEPWWRLLGMRLMRAWPLSEAVSDSGGIGLEFASGDQNPRRVLLGMKGGELNALLTR